MTNTQNLTKCPSHNGTYACSRPAGHTGKHWTLTRFPRGMQKLAKWSDNYSPVTFTRQPIR